MKSFRRNSAVVALLAVLAGCGTAPTKPAGDAVTSAQATAPAPPATGGATAAAASEQIPMKVPSGYKRVKRDGKEVFCRSVVKLGSRFAEEMCFTREQIEEIANRTDSAMDDMERGRKVCVGIEGCGLN